ncbi:MAG: glycosyltransferase family 1 protein [Candidatus Omnitrophica bacterium]|nr:glycosyltransferase family 1 protein [Candidatus Omnitrophota bacterium]
MKIGIDIRSTLKPERTGIGQYTFNLISSLAEIDHHNRYLLYGRIKPFSRKKNPKIRAKNFRFFTERLRLRPEAFFERVDLYHTSSYDLLPPKNKKLVLTIHDVIVKAFPQGHSVETVKETERTIARALEQVSGLIVDSENTRKDIFKWFKFPESRIRVIHLGAGKEFYVLSDKQKSSGLNIARNYGIEDKFILFVGTIEPRKNLSNLIQAFKILKDRYQIKHKLVIVGMKGWDTDKINELVGSSGIDKEIIFTGYLKQNMINLFYNLADCFIYPSLYEGFGIPIVEAFHAGSAVITSNCSSCAEVAGNAALLVDPYSIEEISEAMFKIISDNKLNLELRKKAINRARDFSWDITARKTLNFFQEIYKSSR